METLKLEVITIGDELLSGNIIDTNSAMVAEKFLGLGFEVWQMTSIGDDPRRILEILHQVAARSQVAVVTGGLGPTQDDRTAQAAADAFGRKLELHEQSLRLIRERFDQLGIDMPLNNEKQAWLPEGSHVIPNPDGTAPGFVMEERGCLLLFFPGVPRELEHMLNDTALPLVAKRFGTGAHIVSRSLRIFGLTEAEIDQMVQGALKDITGMSLASLPRFPEIRLRVTARADGRESAMKMLDEAEKRLRKRLGAWVYGVDGDELESVVEDLMREVGKTVSVAESCTGGLIAHRLTNVPGSSEVFDRGFITYSPLAKEEVLGVPSAVLAKHGPVSAAAAKAMAAGARVRAGTSLGLAVTGVAGPGGGAVGRPVGTVFMGLAEGSQCWSQRFYFQGGRWKIKTLATTVALDWLRRYLVGENPANYPTPWRGGRK